jgi:cholesterol transport system auxiliary component
MRKFSIFIYLSLLTGCSLFEGQESLPLYTLKSEMPPSTRELTVSIAIDTPVSEESLNTQRIAVTPSPYQRDYLADGQWPDRLPKILQGALLTSLGQRWGATHLSRVSDGLLATYILRLEIQDFSVHPLDQERAEVHMKLLFKVIDFKNRRVLAAHPFSQKTPVSSYTMIGIVEAFNKGFQALLEQASPWIEETFSKESSLNSRDDKLSGKGR